MTPIEPTAPLKLGIVGLGNAASLVLRAATKTPGIQVSAAVDVREDTRLTFEREYGAPAFASISEMGRSAEIDAAWIATPNQFHLEHCISAAKHGLHVVCEKPMALSIDECTRIIDACGSAGVAFLQESKILQPPVRAIRTVIDSGSLGRAIQIEMWNFNDWMHKPRLAAEYDERLAGSIVFRQAPHQVDIARYLMGSPVRSVRSNVGRWDPNFSAVGNYAALLQFDQGCASLSYNGYGYFDISELYWGIGEGGWQRTESELRRPKPRRSGPMEPQQKYDGSIGRQLPSATRQPFFGLIIVSCERGVIRQSPTGLYVYSEAGCEEIAVPLAGPESPELLELQTALAMRRRPFPDGAWGRATLEICKAIIELSERRNDVVLRHQE